MSALAVPASPTAKLKNILFTTDFSEDSMHGLPYVAGIAGKLGSSVYLCHIVAHSPLVASAPEVAPTLYEGMKEQAAAQLTALAHSPGMGSLSQRRSWDQAPSKTSSATLFGKTRLTWSWPELMGELACASCCSAPWSKRSAGLLLAPF